MDSLFRARFHGPPPIPLDRVHTTRLACRAPVSKGVNAHSVTAITCLLKSDSTNRIASAQIAPKILLQSGSRG